MNAREKRVIEIVDELVKVLKPRIDDNFYRDFYYECLWFKQEIVNGNLELPVEPFEGNLLNYIIREDLFAAEKPLKKLADQLYTALTEREGSYIQWLFRKNILSSYYKYPAATVVRLGFALIFICFGIAKIIGLEPIFGLMYHTAWPWFTSDIGLLLFGFIETGIGVCVALKPKIFFEHIRHAIVLVHLIGTCSHLIPYHEYYMYYVYGVASETFSNFGGSFDIEYSIKVFILATMGLVVLVYQATVDTIE